MATLALLFALAQDEAAVRAVIEKLDGDDVETRNRAQEELYAMDVRVLPLLEKLRPAAGAEAAIWVDQAVEDLRWVSDTTASFAQPGANREAFNKLEVEIAKGKRGRMRAVRLVRAALPSEGLPTDLRSALHQLAERHRLVETWPALVASVILDDNASYAGLQALKRFGTLPAAGEALADGLRANARFSSLLEAALALKAPPAAVERAVRRVLESEPDSNTLSQLMNQIATGKAPVALKTLIDWWEAGRGRRSPYVGDVRNAFLAARPDGSEERLFAWLTGEDLLDATHALEYVARHRLERGAPALARALELRTRERTSSEDVPGAYKGLTPGARTSTNETLSYGSRLVQVLKGFDPEKRAAAWLDGEAGAPPKTSTLVMIGALELKPLAGRVARLLEDPAEDLRREAARTLGALKAEEWIPALEARLKDSSRDARRASLHALVRIRGGKATGRLLEALGSSDPDDQAAAVELMPWADVDEALVELTKPERAGAYMSRYALAALVLRHGEPFLHRVMARLGPSLSTEQLQDFIKLIYAARSYRY